MSNSPGIKFDAGKMRYDLIPQVAIDQLTAILTFGAQKYEPNNWQNIKDGEERYFASLMRHLMAWRRGEKCDSDSRMNHLGHAMCCIAFLLWFDDEQNEVIDIDDKEFLDRLAEVRQEYEKLREKAKLKTAPAPTTSPVWEPSSPGSTMTNNEFGGPY